MLHRHPQLPKPNLPLLRRPLPALDRHRRDSQNRKPTPTQTRVTAQPIRTNSPQSLDELLCEKVCQSLLDQLSSQYPGQIVQILTNLGHFEVACQELQELLSQARSASSAGSGPVILAATEQFRAGKKTAEKRIFELVNSKIDDLIETAEYDW